MFKFYEANSKKRYKDYFYLSKIFIRYEQEIISLHHHVTKLEKRSELQDER
jgi:hypothetical protein